LTAPLRLSGPESIARDWCADWNRRWPATQVLLLLAATDTAAVEGISAAGATGPSRRFTAAADAELLLLGPRQPRPHALPPLPAGVSPALISHVVVDRLRLSALVVDLGCPVAPAVPHLRPAGAAGGGPARCLSRGDALEPARVEALLALGQSWAERQARLQPASPLLVAECVPGGTTTAQALLTGLGVEASGLVSGSLRRPAHALKADLVARGLAAAGLLGQRAEAGPAHQRAAWARQVAACLGDPMQPLAAGLALGAARYGLPLLLAGGSQMAAVLALALALAPPGLLPRLARWVGLATTGWVAREPGSDLALLLRRIGDQWGVEPLAFAADLHIRGAVHPALADYERGYVKEGVGAGGLAVRWQLSGRRPADLALACDDACHQLLAGFPLPGGDGAAGAGSDSPDAGEASAGDAAAGGAAGGLEAAGQAAHGAPVGAGPAAGWEAWVDAPLAEGELAHGAAASYGRGGG
jgi:uncharacterized protein (TIGR00303 family)